MIRTKVICNEKHSVYAQASHADEDSCQTRAEWRMSRLCQTREQRPDYEYTDTWFYQHNETLFEIKKNKYLNWNHIRAILKYVYVIHLNTRIRFSSIIIISKIFYNIYLRGARG